MKCLYNYCNQSQKDRQCVIVSGVLIFGSVHIFSSGFHIILVEWVSIVQRPTRHAILHTAFQRLIHLAVWTATNA